MSELISELRSALRSRHYSRRTEESYCLWVRRYIRFHQLRHPADMAEPEINAFLTHLAVRGEVSASTQTQALSALLFLYRHVLQREIGDLGELVRARRPRRLPVVLTRDEVRELLARLEGDRWLIASLLYGSGLRLMECLRLRVLDLEPARGQITVRDGKGGKDRVTMLPRLVAPALREQLAAARAVHRRDLAEGWGRVDLPGALARKYPNASAEWRWQWVFPQQRRWIDRQTGSRAVTMCTRRSSSARCETLCAAPASQSMLAATRCDIPLPPTCSSPATTSGRSRSCSATRTCAPR